MNRTESSIGTYQRQTWQFDLRERFPPDWAPCALDGWACIQTASRCKRKAIEWPPRWFCWTIGGSVRHGVGETESVCMNAMVRWWSHGSIGDVEEDRWKGVERAASAWHKNSPYHPAERPSFPSRKRSILVLDLRGGEVAIGGSNRLWLEVTKNAFSSSNNTDVKRWKRRRLFKPARPWTVSLSGLVIVFIHGLLLDSLLWDIHMTVSSPLPIPPPLPPPLPPPQQQPQFMTKSPVWNLTAAQHWTGQGNTQHLCLSLWVRREPRSIGCRHQGTSTGEQGHSAECGREVAVAWTRVHAAITQLNSTQLIPQHPAYIQSPGINRFTSPW